MTDTSIPATSQSAKTESERTESKFSPAPARVVASRTSRPASRTRFNGHTTKSYQLAEDGRRTVGHLRQILGQKGLPADAVVTFAENILTLDWEE